MLGPADRAGLDWLAVEEPSQVIGQGGGVGVALDRLFLKTLETDRLQVAWDLGLEPGWRDGFLGPDLIHRVEQRRPLERRPAGQHFVEDRSERVKV